MLTRTYTHTPSLPLQSSSPRSADLRSIGYASIVYAAFAVSVLAPATVMAQQGNSMGQPGHHVAVIDVAHIFKNLPAIKQQVSRVEDDLMKFDAEIKQRRDAAQRSIAQLKTLKVGTPDYARQEEQIANLESRLRLDMTRKQKELRDAEARIYYDNYQRIAAAVKTIAAHNDIQLVLRSNSEDMDLEQSDSVARGVMKNVVYYDNTLDMTKTVMRYLEQQSNTTHVATGSAASATTR